MECVILAGGLGTRMRPATCTVPKALLPVAGAPFADHQLRWLAAEGVDRVVMSIGYKGDLIRGHVGSGRRFGLRVDYVDEGDHLMGTGGALRLALEQQALPAAFLVLYGDSFLPISIRKVWKAFIQGRDPALMTVLRNEGRWDRSNVCYSDGRVHLYDKRTQRGDMHFIDYGLSVLDRDVISEVPAGVRYDLADLFHKLSTSGRLAGLEVYERFYEIGSPTGLADLEALLAQRSSQHD
jgi:NDP-sugar pyrophosphorylase family protein